MKNYERQDFLRAHHTMFVVFFCAVLQLYGSSFKK